MLYVYEMLNRKWGKMISRKYGKLCMSNLINFSAKYNVLVCWNKFEKASKATTKCPMDFALFCEI